MLGALWPFLCALPKKPAANREDAKNAKDRRKNPLAPRGRQGPVSTLRALRAFAVCRFSPAAGRRLKSDTFLTIIQVDRRRAGSAKEPLMSIALSGVFSGMDTDSLVAQLMQVERRPLMLVQQQKAQMQSRQQAVDEGA